MSVLPHSDHSSDVRLRTGRSGAACPVGSSSPGRRAVVAIETTVGFWQSFRFHKRSQSLDASHRMGIERPMGNPMHRRKNGAPACTGRSARPAAPVHEGDRSSSRSGGPSGRIEHASPCTVRAFGVQGRGEQGVRARHGGCRLDLFRQCRTPAEHIYGRILASDPIQRESLKGRRVIGRSPDAVAAWPRPELSAMSEPALAKPVCHG
jgi:hypothetical protein